MAKRSFQPQWFDKWTWFHYDEERDVAFCHTCIIAKRNDHLHTVSNLEQSFISTGFSNWKDAIAKLGKHEASQCHKEAVLKTITLPAMTPDVSEMLASQLAAQRLESRKCFLHLLSNTRFLSRQGLPFCGDGNELDSNYMHLICLRSENTKDFVDWMKQNKGKYTSPESQNEMIQVMSNRVMRNIFGRIRNDTFYSVMIDETTNISNAEQVVVCFRWVNENFEVHEDFVGLYEVESIGAEGLYQVITDVMLGLNLTVSKVRDQCYNGASAMSGKKSGVAAKMQAVEPRAVYTHCYGHALNLACGDAMKNCKLMKDNLDTTHEITKLIKKSLRCDAIFKRLKEEMATNSPGIRVLCPTR